MRKEDPMQRLLALREDIFEGYGENEFCDLLTAQSRIDRNLAISNSERRLFCTKGRADQSTPGGAAHNSTTVATTERPRFNRVVRRSASRGRPRA
jgi:hypothetical protein